MIKKLLQTLHAPAERADEKILKQQTDILTDQSLLVDVLNAVSTAVVILNPERQIIFGNRTILEILEKDNVSDITGFRVGEVMGCIHSDEADGGCGTTEFCRMCGAVNAMLSAQKGRVDIQECRITHKEGSKAYDLRVMASPLTVNGLEFTVFSILDIATEKRKDVLERIFMHDLLNTAGGLQGFSRLLRTATEDDLTEYSEIVNNLADKLVDEIQIQRQLMQAENSQLKTKPTQINTHDVLIKVKNTYLNHEVASSRFIVIHPGAEEFTFSSDETLLMRVIGNMTKNALEAIKSGETITLSCSKKDDKIRFSVQNPGEMPQEAKLQVFQRSFSTKGSGRGLGTYSIKLLGEQYLNGKVGFTSSSEEGTIFFGDFPEALF